MSESTPAPGGGRQLVAALLGAAVSALLFATGLVVPFIGFLTAFLAAVPLTLVRLQGSRAAALAATIIGGVLIALAFSPLVAAWYFAQCGLAGFLVADLSLRGFTPARTVLWSTLAAMVLMALLVTVISVTTGFNPQQFIEKEIQQGLQQAMKLYEAPGLAEQDRETLKSGMESIGQVMLRIYPALATLNLLAVCIITTGLFHRAAARRSLALVSVPFKEFRAPELLVWPAIVAGFAMLAPSPLVTTPALNLLVVLGVVYFMQGLAVLLSLMDRSDYRGLLKAFLAILLLTQPYLAMIVAIIGIFDLWGDFRTPRKSPEENL